MTGGIVYVDCDAQKAVDYRDSRKKRRIWRNGVCTDRYEPHQHEKRLSAKGRPRETEE